MVNRYDLNNPDIAQIKVADFGLSRDYASTYMTGTLGTYVQYFIYSIGWLQRYLIMNLIH